MVHLCLDCSVATTYSHMTIEFLISFNKLVKINNNSVNWHTFCVLERYWEVVHSIWCVCVCVAVTFSHSVVTSSSCRHLNKTLCARSCTQNVIKMVTICTFVADLLLWLFLLTVQVFCSSGWANSIVTVGPKLSVWPYVCLSTLPLWRRTAVALGSGRHSGSVLWT